MGENSNIEWTDHTFNPWIGCTKVSPGCAHCYAEHETFPRIQRSRGRELWGKGQERQRTGKANWYKPIQWNRNCVQRGIRQKVFCASMADWLDSEVPIEWLADLLKLIHDTPNLDWLLLTKRPELFQIQVLAAALHLGGWRDGQDGTEPVAEEDPAFDMAVGWSKLETHPANVWLGVSVENQEYANKRIPLLLQIPARIRFLSAEPLLGRIVFDNALDGNWTSDFSAKFGIAGIHWVIFGGESGPGARPCDIGWIRSGLAQCRAARVAPFVKQLGSDPIIEPGPIQVTCEDPKGGDMAEWPEDLRGREFPQL